MQHSSESYLRHFTDHLGRSVTLPSAPQRIISLCPSQTATLYALGLGDRIVGRTRFCIHPAEHVEQASRVGGTKTVNHDRIDELKPDLIIGEKEENTPEMVAELAARYPVYVTDVRDLESGLQMVRDLGTITAQAEAGSALAEQLREVLGGIRPLAPVQNCVYLIWRKPWMAAGADTFIDAVLHRCGLRNLAHDWAGRYPEFDLKMLQEAAPGLVLLSSEPFPFAEKHLEEIRKILPGSRVELVDGEMFSWYGSRMLHAPAYLNALLDRWR